MLWQDIPIQEYRDLFCQYLLSHHDQEINNILIELDLMATYSVTVNALDLLESNPLLGQMLLKFPTHLLPVFDEALIEAQNHQLRNNIENTYCSSTKIHSHVHIHHLPTNQETTKSNISSLRSTDIGALISLTGTVIRTGTTKMMASSREYQCVKCKHTFTLYADLSLKNPLPIPRTCPKERCKGFKIVATDTEVTCRDYQEMKIQEQISKLDMGYIPRSITTILLDDLVDACKAGDDVVITAIVMQRWKTSNMKDARCDLELFLLVNHIHVHQTERMAMQLTDGLLLEFKSFWSHYYEQKTPLVARDWILASVCPKIYHMFIVKLALLLTIIGGDRQVDESGMKSRGESHLLLIGDPGTGKSECLKFATLLCKRSVLTTGIGSSSAGLTVTAMRDTSGGEWMLEAGALVLADGGICCIDEFDSIPANDRTTIHEAMEQQTISVAKAGLVCTLNTRCTVIGAMNPKGGKFDPELDLSSNTSLATPLLSRFDMILVLQDEQSPSWDTSVSKYILQQSSDHGGNVQTSRKRNLTTAFSKHAQKRSCDVDLWSTDKLQAYIAYIRANIKPEMPQAIHEILTQYYLLQRRSDTGNSGRTTIRMLESLVRLAKAHAKLMFRTIVAVQDAVMAVICMECSVQHTSFLHLGSTLQSTFPDDPDAEYARLERIVFDKLQLHFKE